MAQVTLPYTLTAGTPENVNNLVANLNALVAGINTVDTAQIASSAVTTAKIADANVTADKLAAAVANAAGVNQTGVTNRSAMTAMTTERSQTNFVNTDVAFVDVTGASLSFTVASGSYIIVGYNAEVKCDSASGYWRVLADTAVCNGTFSPSSGGALTTGYADGFTSSYVKVGGMAMFSAAALGTGSKTFKWQFGCYGITGTPTVYLKNAYLTVTQVTF